jgi:phosphoribosylamine---glycine ligase
VRVLIIDADRVGLDFALRCIDADHEVKLFRPPALNAKDGKGFPGLTIVNDYRDHMKWARDGLIITTANCKYLDDLDRYREYGYNLFAPTKDSAKLEIDRGLGMEVMKQHGMNIPDYKQFKNLKDCLEFAWKAKQCYVFKTLGSEENKALSFVPSDPGQLVAWIQGHIDKGLVLKGPCMLQEKVEDMVGEVGIAGFMGSEGFLEDKWEISFEHKKFMSGEYGPNTGEQGTVIQLVKKSPLAEILKGFETHLRALGHMGDIAINGAVDKRGRYWPFEFTCRAGWPDQYIRFSLHYGDPAQWMVDAMNGKDSLKVSYDVAIGVVVAQKPYPFKDGLPEEVEGNPIYIDGDWDNVHFAHVMLGDGPVWDGKKTEIDDLPLTTGTYTLVCTGRGETVSEARKAVYGQVKKIRLYDMLVRDDIGEKLEAQLPVLHKLDIAKEMRFA